ncbi:anti-sigma factor [Fulvivirga sp. RKSG066]|uniref:anti-sigma factor n=1 Tax=Fulvivirga aurantia TaxID=2529383 RepID=UPI0012BD2465|nr:anti-sigma factor [Fulvivirga aurantia]MTI22004.1 anti-sigma factor [Fulvivirga aurantia]
MAKPSTDSHHKNPSNDDANTPDHGECLKILSLVLDEEATDEEREYFKKHVENCMPYYEIYNVDLKIKELIKKNCAHKEVPQDLVDSIREKIFHKAE